MVARNKEAMEKHWEDFKKSEDYGMKPYFPLFISPGLVGIDFDEDDSDDILSDGWRN